MTDNTIWPRGYNFSGSTFSELYEDEIEFREFTINEMKKPTEFFKLWKDYCIHRKEKENVVCLINNGTG